jgi:integrase
MPKPRPPYLLREQTRWGKVVWFVRIGKGPRTRIHGEYGSSDFMAEYQAAVSGRQRPANEPRSGSLAWLIERYRESPAWTHYSLATRRQRENILRQVIEAAGTEQYKVIKEATIAKGRDRRGATPFQARHFVDTMRGLFGWAKEAGFVRTDPAANVKYPQLKSDGGFPEWTEEEVTDFYKRWPIGTRERVWFDVLSYTGLRRGDAVVFGRQHLREYEWLIKTEKSGGEIEVLIPQKFVPELVETLRAGPTSSEMAYICGASGRPLTKESFGNLFREACRKAGIKKSAHGLRKLAAIRATEAGAGVPELNGMFGWTGSKMALFYTQRAERKHLSRQGFEKTHRRSRTADEHSMPAPNDKVRA